MKPSNLNTEGMGIISGLLLPVKDANVLLPNVSVAEVVDYQAPQNQEGNPDWYLGTVSWRGIDLPVVSFEVANGQTAGEIGDNPRIVVINNIGSHHEKIAFFAIVTQNIPRLVKIDSSNIEENTSDKTGVAEKMNVAINDEVAAIPDIEYLQGLLHKQFG